MSIFWYRQGMCLGNSAMLSYVSVHCHNCSFIRKWNWITSYYWCLCRCLSLLHTYTASQPVLHRGLTRDLWSTLLVTISIPTTIINDIVFRIPSRTMPGWGEEVLTWWILFIVTCRGFAFRVWWVKYYDHWSVCDLRKFCRLFFSYFSFLNTWSLFLQKIIIFWWCYLLMKA